MWKEYRVMRAEFKECWRKTVKKDWLKSLWFFGVWLPSCLYSHRFGFSRNNKEFSKCLPMILTISLQLVVVIFITVSILFYSSTYYTKKIESTEFKVDGLAPESSNLKSYVKDVVNGLLTDVSRLKGSDTGPKNEFIIDKLTKLELNYKFNSKTTLAVIGDIKYGKDQVKGNFFLQEKCTMDSSIFKSSKENGGGLQISVRGLGKSIAEIAQLFLKACGEDASMAISLRSNSTGLEMKNDNYIGINDFHIREIVSGSKHFDFVFNNGSTYFFEGEKSPFFSNFTECEIIVPREFIQFKSTRIKDAVREDGSVSAINKAIMYNPFLSSDNFLVRSSPLWFILTLVFALMGSVFAAYTKEKMSYVYECKEHCKRRVVYLLIVPIFGSLGLFTSVGHYISQDYKHILFTGFKLNWESFVLDLWTWSSDSSLLFILKMCLPVVVVALLLCWKKSVGRTLVHDFDFKCKGICSRNSDSSANKKSWCHEKKRVGKLYRILGNQKK
ncbi:hypothetical protein [Maridesulfovibrio frigidus]|uniref:hypothetical protein n=1 Tax=Maridesulfovibrio frigidus TaxID=340956 RepID=UPI0004E26715|nr:hypothetical protein [Maridesulfovibrio frigidus]